jgi:DNA polymerase III delta prime subunit
MDLSEYNEGSCAKILVYGPPKSGKTALVGKLAEAGFKLHWCDLEQGIKTLLNPAILKPEFRKNINVINIPDHRLNPIAIDTMKKILKGQETKVCYNHGVVNCPMCAKDPASRHSTINLGAFTKKDVFVIDSLSQLADSAMNRVIKKELAKPDGDEYKPTFNDYMAQGANLQQVLSLIQVLDLNICVISHEVDTEKDEKKEKINPQAGTRNFSKLVAKYFDAVIHCEVVNKQHRAFGSSTYAANVTTGSRFGGNLDELKGGELSLVPYFNRT